MVESNWEAPEKKFSRHYYSARDETVEVVKRHVEQRYFVPENKLMCLFKIHKWIFKLTEMFE